MNDEEDGTGRPRLSHSQVDRLHSCSWKWYLERACGHLREQVPSWAAVAGSAVHVATETIDRRAVGLEAGGPDTFAGAFAACIEHEEALCGHPRGTWKATGRKTKAMPRGKNYEWWLTEGQRQVNSWKRWVESTGVDIWFTPDGQPGIELKLETVRRGVGTLGSADRVYQIRGTKDLLVVDIKTGRKPVTAQQLGDYADAIARVHGVDVAYGSFWLGSTGMVDDVHSLDHWVGHTIEATYDKAAGIIENKSFSPSPGMACSYCGVREYCYAVSGIGPEIPMPSCLEGEQWKKEENLAA